MRLSWFSLIMFAAIVCLSGCATPKSSKPEVTVEEIKVKDATVDHADQPVLEFESKESK